MSRSPASTTDVRHFSTGPRNGHIRRVGVSHWDYNVFLLHLAVGNLKKLAEHANWLNRGRIHRNVPVVDVSPANDWSQVRLWYVPGNHLGSNVYPAHGFIHPVALTAGLS